MVKVTFCAYDKPDNVGGPVSWLQRLGPLLRERGFEVRCLFIMHWGNRGPALDSLTAAGIECSVATGVDNTQDRIRWILDEVRKNPPDVFVPNLVVAAYFASKWLREAGIPTVGVLHSDDDFYRAIQHEFVTGETRFRVSSVVCVSEHLEAQLRLSAPRDVKVQRIPYGVTIPERRVHREHDALRLCYVGRLAEEQKRISDVVKALCRASSEVPGVDAIIYGDGPDRDIAERAVETSRSKGSVSFAGNVESAAIQDRLLQCDAIVLLSDYEGLPIALLEAMSCGCVPVCSEMESGIPELVRNETTGLIVENRGDAFVSAVERLRFDSDLWHRLSYNSRELIANRYSEEISADRWSKLLRSVGQGSQRRKVRIPRKLRLPPVNSHLASADTRRPETSLSIQAYKRGRMFIGRFRRRAVNFFKTGRP